MLSWILVGALLVIAYGYYRWTIRNLLKVNEMFPGPTPLPLLGCAIEIFYNRRDLVGWGTKMLWYYRRSLRVWLANRVFILITDAPDAEKVLGNTDNIEKADQYVYLLDWIGRGLLTSFGSKWKKHRKILTPAFHFNILETFLSIFNDNGTILIEKLNDKVDGPNFDAYEIIKLYALDNIAEAAMGTKVNAQIHPDSEYVKSIKTMCNIVFSRILSPWLWPDFIFKLSSLGKRQESALKSIHGLTNEVIAKRREELKQVLEKNEESDDGTNIRKRRVFLDILLQSADENGLTNEDIREEVDTFMFEGHDTVTSAISFALYLLAENQEWQERVYQEIQEVMGGSERNATTQDLQSMKYLEMVIKETLRLYPSVPLLARHVEKDIVLDEGATIPKGSEVVIVTQVLHQYYRIWEKPQEFYPEHFEPEAMAKRHPFQYIPFSAGPRNCIGMRFAMLEMKATLARILRNFVLLPADPPVPLSIAIDLIMVSETGTNIRLKHRPTATS